MQKVWNLSKPKKSVFALSEGKLLGFIVSKQGICIDPKIIKAISEIPLPHTKKSMQYFLGQINFVKRFVPEFSQIVLPLQKIIKNDSLFKWGDHERKAFKAIKQAVANPNVFDQFILYTFAS